MAGKQHAARRWIVLVDGGPTDEPVIEMACTLAREKEAQLYVVRPILVERALPLDAPLPEAAARSRAVLERAQRVAERHGCQVQARELRTRDIATALVDEAADLGCEQILLGICGEQRGIGSPFTIAEQVLRMAPCPVWLYYVRGGR